MPTTSQIQITVKSSELRQGDIVLCHGMRCLIDGPVETFRAGSPASQVYCQRARVLNRDQVDADSVPIAYTAPREGETDHRWMIQGNDLVSWVVERQAFERDDRVYLVAAPQWQFRVNFQRPDGTVSVYDVLRQDSFDYPAASLALVQS